MPRLSEQQRQEIAAEHAKGVSKQELAKRFGVSRPTISRTVQREAKGAASLTSPDTRIGVRVPPEVGRSFAEWCRRGDISRSEALRAFVRSPSTHVVVDHALRAEIEALRREVSANGTNLNQIARRLNAASRKGEAQTYTPEDRQMLSESWKRLDHAQRSLQDMLQRLPKPHAMEGEDGY